MFLEFKFKEYITIILLNFFNFFIFNENGIRFIFFFLINSSVIGLINYKKININEYGISIGIAETFLIKWDRISKIKKENDKMLLLGDDLYYQLIFNLRLKCFFIKNLDKIPVRLHVDIYDL